MAHKFTDVRGDKRRHTIVFDLDGTLVENKWPELGDWMPGAINAVRTFHAAGCTCVVFSARLNPTDPWTKAPRNEAEVMGEFLKVRKKLDDAGLTYVDIWDGPGKPGGSVYIDDRAERYHGRPKSWNKLTEKILVRLNLVEEVNIDGEK